MLSRWPKIQEIIKRTKWTVIAWHFARRTTPFIRYATDTTNIFLVVLFHIPRIPTPLGHCMPLFDGDFHGIIVKRICPQTQGFRKLSRGECYADVLKAELARQAAAPSRSETNKHYLRMWTRHGHVKIPNLSRSVIVPNFYEPITGLDFQQKPAKTKNEGESSF